MSQPPKRLYRTPKDGVIAGVASGFAQYFNMDVTLMRLVFIAGIIVTHGVAIVAYIALAFIMPTADKECVGWNINERMENLASEVRDNGRLNRVSNYLGFGIVLLGLWLLAGQFFPGWADMQWSIIWPCIIIVLGILIMARSKRS